MSPIGSRLRSRARSITSSTEGVVSVGRCRHGAQLGAGALRWGDHGGQFMLNHLAVARAASSTCCGSHRTDHGLVEGPGSPTLTSELQKKLIDGVHAEAGSPPSETGARGMRSCLAPRTCARKHPQTVASREAAAE